MILPKNVQFRVFPVLLLLFVLCSVLQAQQSKLERAAGYYTGKNFTEALKLFEEIINSGSGSEEVYSAAIDCAAQLKDFKKALNLTQKALTRYKSSYYFQTVLPQLYVQTGALDEAIITQTRLVTEYPDTASLKLMLSELHTFKGGNQYKAQNMGGAVESFKLAVKYNSRNKEARVNLLILLLKDKQHKAALPFAKEGYTFFPDDKGISVMYLEILIATENFKDAVTVSERIAKKNPDDIQAGLNNALAYRYNGEPMKAYYKYAELRSKFPKAKEVYTAEIAFLQLNEKTDTIIARYREFLSLTPDDREMIIGLGKTYEGRKSYDTARSIYKQLIEKDLDRDGALLIAECYSKEKRLSEAIDEYRRYILSGGKNTSAFDKISELLKKTNKDEEARDFLKRAINLYPAIPEFAIALAKSYYFKEDYDSALIRFEPVKHRYGQYPEISYYTARIYNERKDTAKSVFHLIRAIKSSIEQSQQLQAQILSSVSGENLNSADSIESARAKGAVLDTVSTLLKDCFMRLLKLQTPKAYLATIKKLIIDIPTAGLLYLQRARFYLAAGALNEAEQDFATALLLSPSSFEVQGAVAEYYEAAGKPDNALLAYKKAAALNKKEPLFYRKIIDLADRLNELNEVCEHWLIQYQTDKKNLLLREFLIEALHKAGRIKEAEVIINDQQN